MPSRKTKAESLPPPWELIDRFATRPMSAEAAQAASMAFEKALIGRAPGAGLSHRLGDEPGATKPGATSNHRNGSRGKTVLTEEGTLRLEVPRRIPKHERRFTGALLHKWRCCRLGRGA